MDLLCSNLIETYNTNYLDNGASRGPESYEDDANNLASDVDSISVNSRNMSENHYGKEEWGEFLHIPNQKFYNFEEICEEIRRDTFRLHGFELSWSALLSWTGLYCDRYGARRNLPKACSGTYRYNSTPSNFFLVPILHNRILLPMRPRFSPPNRMFNDQSLASKMQRRF